MYLMMIYNSLKPDFRKMFFSMIMIRFWIYLWETQSTFIISFTEFTNFFPWSPRFSRSVIWQFESFKTFNIILLLFPILRWAFCWRASPAQTSYLTRRTWRESPRPWRDYSLSTGFMRGKIRIVILPFCRFDPIDLANGLIAGRQTAARLSSKQVWQWISPLIMIDWIKQGNHF